jgi:hypothetical protein
MGGHSTPSFFNADMVENPGAMWLELTSRHGSSRPSTKRTNICAVPFCRGVRLTLKSLKPRDYVENPRTLGQHLKKRRRELGLLQ